MGCVSAVPYWPQRLSAPCRTLHRPWLSAGPGKHHLRFTNNTGSTTGRFGVTPATGVTPWEIPHSCALLLYTRPTAAVWSRTILTLDFFPHWIQTFDFRDLFFCFLLHDFLSKLDLRHLRHFLSLCKSEDDGLNLAPEGLTTFLTSNCLFTDHSFDPLRLRLLLHDLLCLLRDQQLCLLALPADIKKNKKQNKNKNVRYQGPK